MADQVLTKQKLIDADEDVQALEDVVNGEPGKLIKTRLGREVYTLSSVPQINTMTREEVAAAVAPKANQADVNIALSNLSATANKFYPTLATAIADIANIALNQSVTIGEEANSGLWYKATAGATSLTKSPYDPLTQAKEYSDSTSKKLIGKTVTDGYYSGNGSSPYLATANQGAGFIANYGGVLTSFTAKTTGATASVKLQVYERYAKGLKLKSTELIPSIASGVEAKLQQPVRIKKGDFIILAFVSGAPIATNPLTDLTYPLGSIAIPVAVVDTIGSETTYSRTNQNLEFKALIQRDDLQDINPNENYTDLDKLSLAIGSKFGVLQQTTGQILSSTTSPGGNLYAYGTANTAKKNSLINEISFTTRTPNGFVDVVIYTLKPSLSGFIVSSIEQVRTNTNSIGVATISGLVLSNRFVEAGGYVLVSGITAFDSPLSNATTGSWSYVAVAELNPGSRVSVLMNTNSSISLKVVYDSADIDLISNSIKPPVFSKIILNEMFNGSSLPSNWSQTGGWTVNNGLKSPAVGGWTTVAKHAQYSAMAKRVYRAKFLVSNASSVFGICTSPIEGGAGSAVAMVDGVQNKLIIYSWDGLNAGTQVASVDIPALVAGQNYYLQVEKNGYYSVATLTNTLTQQSTKVEYSSYVPYVQFHGQAGVIFISGDITVKHFNFNTLYPEKPHAIIIGDSNSERAANVLPNETWAFKFAELRKANADVIVAGRSGDETPNFLKRKDLDLKIWKPKYVILALGTNDTSQETWRANTAQNIVDIVALGAEPILVTQVPRGSISDIHYLMDEDIRNGYFGNYRYVDFAKAVSTGNNGYTWNPSYNSGDNLHVNPAGQQVFLNQLLADIPDLLY